MNAKTQTDLDLLLAICFDYQNLGETGRAQLNNVLSAARGNDDATLFDSTDDETIHHVMRYLMLLSGDFASLQSDPVFDRAMAICSELIDGFEG
ncbi:MAG: hypothetical protein ACLQUT_05535 [Thermoleophilia bacterium]